MEYCSKLNSGIKSEIGEENENIIILDIQEIARNALLWAYRVTHWYHFNVAEKVTEVNTDNLSFLDYIFDRAEKLSQSTNKKLLHRSEADLINIQDYEQTMSMQGFKVVATSEVSTETQYGINVDGRFEKSIRDKISSKIIRIEGALSCGNTVKKIKTYELSIVMQSVLVKPRTKVSPFYELSIIEGTYKIYLSGIISGNISGIINLKLGKKIKYSVDIGFAIYCLEIMGEAPVGVYASEDQKHMISKGITLIRKSIASHISFNTGKEEPITDY